MHCCRVEFHSLVWMSYSLLVPAVMVALMAQDVVAADTIWAPAKVARSRAAVAPAARTALSRFVVKLMGSGPFDEELCQVADRCRFRLPIRTEWSWCWCH